MKTAKIILAISGLIGIGFIAGFMSQRYIAKERIEKVRGLGRGMGMQDRLFHAIDATEEQKTNLAPIIEGYSLELDSNVRSFKLYHRSIIDSMHADLKPYLSPEQVEKLDQLPKRKRKFKNA